VSSTVESMLGRSLDETFWVEVMGLVAKFRKLEERYSRLEQPGVRICDMLLGLPPCWARLAHHQNKAAVQLGVE
jgi:hypothetical protein